MEKRTKGILTDMSISRELEENRALRAMKMASHIAEKNGIADMTLDEINAEIAKTRNAIR